MNPTLLICTLGASWPVIPEVYGFLAPERLPLYRHHPDRATFKATRLDYRLQEPAEIWICTTLGKRTQDGVAKLHDWLGKLDQPPVLRVWQAQDTDDLASQAECERFRELLLRVCLLAHARAEQVILSLAGGRKTMSADLQWAGSLFGCPALVHVVGKEPLPDALRTAAPDLFTAPLPAELAAAVVPLVAGSHRRSELLDVDLDGLGPVDSERFPLPLAEPGQPLAWSAPADAPLCRELRRREAAGGQLLGNFLEQLGRHEHHENWRSLYRLPPRVIERLRQTPLTPRLSDWLRSLPKADLHRHVGGCLDLPAQRQVGAAIWDSLRPAEQNAAWRQVRELLQTEEWPWDWPERLRQSDVPRAHITATLLTAATDAQLQHNLYAITEPRYALKTRHPRGFAAYERPGELSGSALLGHPAAIAPYAASIVRSAVAEGLALVELRGSPHKYGDGDGFLLAFHNGLTAACLELPPEQQPRFRFILIVDRRQPEQVGEVIALAVRAKDRLPGFIAGLDLAGDESVTAPAEIAAAFLPAFERCLPLTIHAGEGEAADSIWQAAYHLHADRIGHGLSISEHEDLAARFRDRGICLELCPTSNREVVGFHDPDRPETTAAPRYPLRTLWEAGLPLTLCTDNPGFGRTTLTDEYLTAARMIGELTVWDALALIRQGFLHAFLPGADKEKLLKTADARIYRAVLERFTDTVQQSA